MGKVHVTIDGIQVYVPDTYTVLEAAKEINIHIPTLCFLKDVSEIGCCRMCLVEVKGTRALQAACGYPVRDGMEVRTHTPELLKVRQKTLELILSNHPARCQSCTRTNSCELQILTDKMDVHFENYVKYQEHITSDQPLSVDEGISIQRDPNRCILCRRCVSVCNNIQTVGAISAINRGYHTVIGAAENRSLDETVCVNCGQCINVCPTGALQEHRSIDEVMDALYDPEKHVIVQTAPAVRAALGEEFGNPIGTDVTGKMVTALRMLGFDKVFDTDTAADLTIMEEGTELIDRIRGGGVLPLITSCSPGWISYCEKFYPEFIPNLSSCKSPHEMTGAVVKSYFAEKAGIDPKSIYVVSVMPCTAKKYEAKRPELSEGGLPDVDAVLTVRELARMIKQSGIDYARLPDEDFDPMLGESTGASVIFGATGGVMEAALRTVYEVVTGKTLDSVDFTAVRGIEGVKEAEIDLDGTKVSVAVAHSTGNAKKLLEAVKNGEKKYHFIEVMGCPGGCVTGGGQPIVCSKDLMYLNVKELRAKALYTEDAGKAKRKSHENTEVKKLYDEYLGEIGGHRAHELLHTSYSAKSKF